MKKAVSFALFCLLVPSLFAAEKGSSGDSDTDEGKFLSRIRQVTFEGRRAGEGYFGPEGTQLVFQSERDPENPFFQIFLLDLTTGDIRKVSPGIGKTTCSWIHPDGNRVLFASTHEDPDARTKQEQELKLRAEGRERRYSWDYDEFFNLYEADLNSGEIRRLTSERGYDAEGSWSPDGRLIAFASTRQAYSRPLTPRELSIFKEDKAYFSDIYIMNSDGSDVRQLTDVPGYDGGPFFSPDGSQICWRRFSEDGATAEIYVMNVDGSHQQQITHLGAMSWAPFFHPSGDYLIFATNRHGFSNFELYLVDRNGKHTPVRVTSTEGFDGLPAFSPDGKTLAWTSNRTPGGQSQIFFAEWNDEYARRQLELVPRLETSPPITISDLKKHVEKLASDTMEGRLTGSEGARLATQYGADLFRAYGLQPAGQRGTYFQEFEFTARVRLGTGNRLSVEAPDQPGKVFAVDTEWRPVAFSKEGELGKAPVVFAGYGLVAPAESPHEEYDSYVHLDVTDKWVLAFRYLPESVTPERRQHLARYSRLRYKAMAARERGARGLLLVSGPNSQVKEELVKLSFDASLGTTGIGILSISDAVGAELLTAAGKDLAALQNELDKGEPVMGFEIPGVVVDATVDIVREKERARNVLARLVTEGVSGPEVVVGAHIDHLGRGLGMSTLAREEEKGQIHFGADDNASGVAGLLEMAEYLSDQVRKGRLELQRGIVFALWSGEELGLLGSNHFMQWIGEDAEDPNNLSGKVAAYLNMDMIGRLRKELILQGVGSSSLWPKEIERRNAVLGLPIATQNDSYLPTDSTSFYLKGIPVLSAFTGTHSEYHSPRDRPETLNYEGMEKVARFMTLVARSLVTSADAPDYVQMKRPSGQGGRARLRAYLGTIPDYAQGDIAGVKLGGVVGGGPAEQAGLQGGDVIVELAGRKIENIYDYTYAIEALKIGQPVTIVVERADKRVSLTVTPSSRE